MKRKFASLAALGVMATATVLATQTPTGERTQQVGKTSEVQIAQLDKRLAERVAEQQELLSIVERLLNMNFQQKLADQDKPTQRPLSGSDKPKAVAKSTVKAKPAPWWRSLSAQMVYISDADRYAVLNGKMYTIGQSPLQDVLVQAIEEDAVVLKRGKETHTFLLHK